MNDVTIIIKTFERLESLIKLLESIRQFYPFVHIIIADDSRKPSVQEITSRFSNIEYVPLRFDVGLSAGRNALLSRIKTKYFVLCDDDFLFYEQTKLENFKKILDETDIELIGGCVMDKSRTGEYDKPNLYAGNFVLDSSRHLHMKLITIDSPFVKCDIVPNWFMAVTEAVKQKTGGWDPKLKIEEHTDFFWRAKQADLKVAFTPDVRVNHTQARNPEYLFYRDTRVNKYYLYYFKKLRIKGFTDKWETVTLRDVQPRWFKFIFEQKGMPWFIILRWRKFIEKYAQAKSRCIVKYQLNQRGVVLMYHRVVKLDHDPWQLCVTPDHFEEHMQVIKKYGRPVQMRRMGKNLHRFAFGRKEIVLSFDDGYADNFHNAKPILERHKVPATFFIVSGAVGSPEEYWWDELERVTLFANSLPGLFELNIAGTKYSWPINFENAAGIQYFEQIPQNNTPLSKSTLYYVLWKILSGLSVQGKKEALQDIGRWAGQKPESRPTHRVMTAQEITSMAHSSLFEIGAHTYSHPLLENLPVKEQEQEIGRSKQDLEKLIKRPVTSFSYPHGNYSNDTLEIVKRLNFKNACTVSEKLVMQNADPFRLPRFTVFDWDGSQFENNMRRWMKHE